MAATEAVVLPDEAYSDYGSDLDTDGEQLLDDLLSQAEADAPKLFVLETIEDTVTATANAFIPNLHASQSDVEEYFSAVEDQVEGPATVEIERHREPETASTQARAPILDSSRSVSVEPAAPEAIDARSPLERFRKPPLKALSVTDLVSPAWCELQYWYTLTKHGRKKRTPAMKQGSKVHKVLEEQVHQVVPVDIQTKEDGWGLRIWNVIQGVRTLRVTGMTRELEVWGVIDGQVVNGIIDELSFTCPDPELEAGIVQKQKDGLVGTSLPATQTSIKDFWTSSGARPLNSSAWLRNPYPQRRVYLTDVKTRSSKTLPQSSALRPTKMQLMLYHFLLASIATNRVNADTIFSRYRLDASVPFSDSFIAEIGSLDFNFHNDSNADDYSPFGTQEDSVSELLSHNSLSQLWSLMIAEFIKTLPSADAIGDVLKAEFRSQNNGAILGSKTFAYDDAALRAYVEDEMRWWKGERQARGVDIEEAYKCRICEFAGECEWRKSKIDEATQKSRARQAASRT